MKLCFMFFVDVYFTQPTAFLLCLETKSSSLHVQAAAAQKNASLVPQRLSSGWQHLQQKCLEKHSSPSQEKCTGRTVANISTCLHDRVMPVHASHHNRLPCCGSPFLMGRKRKRCNSGNFSRRRQNQNSNHFNTPMHTRLNSHRNN